jgi:(E)-4-hydroxy-3-methylbut-2-enyl-diphosphate synthase
MSHTKEYNRRKSRRIWVRDVPIGDGAPITVQSMTTTDPHDIEATAKQIAALEEAGCELVRITIPDYKAAEAIVELKKRAKVPLIADIHFNHKLALESMKYGIDALRLNPGNVDEPSKVGKVCDEAKARGIPIRIGVNSGSLPLDLVEKYGEPCAEGMVEAAFRHHEVLDAHGFKDYKVSVKSTNVRVMSEAYRMLAAQTDAPLHIGLTEAGMRGPGSIKSAMAIGSLLMDGIGDTIRVSLTGEPCQEVEVGFEILKHLGLRKHGMNVIACPTCGRLAVDVEGMATRVAIKYPNMKKSFDVAVIGCAVNGPGEAKDADIGVAGGKGVSAIYRSGKVVGRYRNHEIETALYKEIDIYLSEDAAAEKLRMASTVTEEEMAKAIEDEVRMAGGGADTPEQQKRLPVVG